MAAGAGAPPADLDKARLPPAAQGNRVRISVLEAALDTAESRRQQLGARLDGLDAGAVVGACLGAWLQG